jgi:DNA-binding PadR family transcriptional regulator
MVGTRLSVTDHAVLGVLAEHPTHGFALAKELGAGGGLGRILTVRPTEAYRSLDRLVTEGLAEPARTEPGDSGPRRIVHRVTPAGRRRLRRWLGEPVGHVRDLRIEFQLKLALLDRANRPPLELIAAQSEALTPTIVALEGHGPIDHVELWRQHVARAAGEYLDDLARRYGQST